MADGQIFYSLTNNNTETQANLSSAANNHKDSLIFDTHRQTLGVYHSVTFERTDNETDTKYYETVGFKEYGTPVKEMSLTAYRNLATKDSTTLYVITS